MSRPNTFQVALSVDAAAVLKRRAALVGLPPSTLARSLLTTALAVHEPARPTPKKAKR